VAAGHQLKTQGPPRKWSAKDNDLSGFSADYLDVVADKLNRRPRQTLK
jgi:IS30 family transposase